MGTAIQSQWRKRKQIAILEDELFRITLVGEYIAKNLPLAIFAVMTGVEEVGLEDLEIFSPINGCGCS